MFVGKDLCQAGHEGYDGSISTITTKDLNSDGYLDLLCTATTGFDIYPRGILAYDYRNNEELWHFWIGSMPSTAPPTIYDINNDDRDEIIFGTGATCNGGDQNGVDDFHSWVIVLGCGGELIWKKAIGEANSIVRLWVGDLYDNGKPVVVVCEEQGLSDKKDPNRITIYDAQTGDIRKYIGTGERFLGMYVCDLDRDGKMEIVTGNSDGVVRVFNRDLVLINQRAFNTGIKVDKIEDLDGNGTKEVLLLTQDGQIKILDERIETLCDCKIKTGHIEECFLARNGKQFRIIARMHAGIEQNYTIYKIERAGFIKPVPPFAFAAVILIILCIGAFLITLNRIRFVKIMKKMIDKAPCGFIVLDSKNKVKYLNRGVRVVLGNTEDDITNFIELPQIKEQIENLKQKGEIDMDYSRNGESRHLVIELHEINHDKMLIIHDETQEILSKNVISWAELAQRLAHEIKNPLSTINLTLQRIQSIGKEKFGVKANVLDKYTDSVLGEVDRLRHTTDKFMRVLSIEKPNLKPNRISDLLNVCLQRYKATLSGRIKVVKDMDANLPMVMCDDNQVGVLFANIVENAVDAITGEGVLTLRASLIEQVLEEGIVKFVEVKIEDTGKGMSNQEFANLFKPFNSTKTRGTGLGLVIAKKIVDEHHGIIKVDSKEDIGTVVTIQLPVGSTENKANNE